MSKREKFNWDTETAEVINAAALELALQGLDATEIGAALARIYIALPENEQSV